MNYDNLTCRHCGKPMLSSEDIVVCPVCATPQHRECWMQAGHCANDSLHASGFVWKKETDNTVNEYKAETAPDSKACHICGSENPSDSLHCGNCGALFGETKNENPVCARCGTKNDTDARHCKSCGAPLVIQGEFFSSNPYLRKSEFKEDDLIAGQKAGDLALYIQMSSHRYLRKFRKFADGKKFTLNFAAFFFAPYWFFYRKLYKAGAFFVVLFATVSLMLTSVSADVSVYANEFLNNYGTFDYQTATEEEAAAFEKGSTEFFNKIKKPLAISAAVNLGLSLIAALAADRLYYKKVFEDMKAVSDTVKEENMRKFMITRKGGLSALAFAASVLGYNVFINLMVYAADFITNSL